MLRPPRRSSLAALIAALLFALALPASATVMRKLDLDALIDSADLVVHAEVLGLEAVQKGKRVVTRVELKPHQALKGAVDGPLTVRVMGGTVGPVGQRVAGTARFEAGEQVIVFLTALDDGDYRVRGMAQGKLRVVPDLAGGHVVRDLGGLTLVEVDADGAVGQKVAAPAEMPLDAFVRAVAVRLARQGPATPAAPAAEGAADDLRPR